MLRSEKDAAPLLRLRTSTAGRRVPFGPIAALTMRQPGQLHFDIATNAAKAAARKLSENAERLFDYGLEHLAGDQTELMGFLSDDADGLIGYGKHLLAVHLGMMVIDHVHGVLGLDGNPMDKPVKRDLSAFFIEFIPGMGGRSYGSCFLTVAEQGVALEISEGNVSAVAPDGYSGAAVNTAKAAKQPGTAAPKAAADRRKGRGKKA